MIYSTRCLTDGCNNEPAGGWYEGVPYYGWRNIRSADGSPPMYCKECMSREKDRRMEVRR